LFFGLLDEEDLGCHDGKHFDVYTVELIETAPCPADRETFEEVGHGERVESL
jgi:hypothetical protein